MLTRDSAAGWLAKVAGRISQRLRSQLQQVSSRQKQTAELDQLPEQHGDGDDLEKRELWGTGNE